MIYLISFIGLCIQIQPFLFESNPVFKQGAIALYVFLGMLNTFFDFNLLGFKLYFKQKIKEFILKFILG